LLVEIKNIKYNKREKELIISMLEAVAFLFKLFLSYLRSVFRKVLNSTNKIRNELILHQVEPILNN